ncbi:MAG TPA: permease-like cell division protein FtsX [Bacteroidales bacterium]|nr:permease-like cell division protein FtsX [Bacteroidales bacterium]HPS62659.1 permease-like cell division protein FtsX [Bacteroidales bacterium]
MSHEQRYYRRRIAASQVTTIISITLVLFLTGLVGMILLHARILSDQVRENIGFSVMIRDDVREPDILQIKKMLDLQPFVKSSEYLSREKAAEKLKNDLGEDFTGFLGYNPLLPSIEMRIKADWARPDSLRRIEKHLLATPGVKEVFYQQSLVDAINRNIEKISLVLLGFGAILLFIAIVLINNTIRLAVYARRFIIRSMQLVGATEGFIRRPMLRQSILHGLISAFIALLALMGITWFALDRIPELAELEDPLALAIIAAGIPFLGMAISWIATQLAVRKYLRLHTDLLYS